jgi:hypothetical protein
MVALRTEQEQQTENNNKKTIKQSKPRTAVRRTAVRRTTVRHLRLVPREPLISIYRPDGIHPDDILPLVRKDSLPERMAYADAGCELAQSCLACPLPKCQYDEPGSVRTWLLDARDHEIAVLRRRHRAPINALAHTYNLTRRQIFRILGEQSTRSGKREAGS